MPPLLIALLACLVAAVSLWGWGRPVRRWAGQDFGVPLTIALGLAVVIALGGVFNLARIAYPRVLDGIVVVGLGLAGLGIKAAWQSRRTTQPEWLGMAVACLPVVVAGVFLASHLLPWSAYNTGDDFEKYFAHPVRMLETGTLAPNLLGPLGAETLGAQALLHAFALAHFPVSFLGAADSLFFFLLCMVLAAFAAPVGRWGIGGAAAAVCVAVITPQIVNVSALFSGALLVMAAVLLGASAAGGQWRIAVLLGLVYAGLFALKATFTVFVALHLLALPLTAGASRGRCWAWAAVAAGSTVLFLAPWLALHAPLYLAESKIPIPEIPPHAGSAWRALFLSAELNNYGISQLQATLVAVTVLLLAMVAGAARWRGAAEEAEARFAGVAAAGGAVFAVFVGTILATDRYVSHVSGATRYLTPVLIGVLPAQLALLARSAGPVRRAGVASAVVALGLVGLFWRPLWGRVEQIRELHTPLAFVASMPPALQGSFLGYNRRVLSGLTGSTVRQIQELVPRGEPLGAWIMTAYVLDFARNPIHHADPAGLVTPWAQIPDGTRYFLLEYGGYAARTAADFQRMASNEWPAERRIGEAELAFARQLRERMQRSRILYDDGVYLLMRLEAEL